MNYLIEGRPLVSTAKSGVPYFVQYLCRHLFSGYPGEQFTLWAQNLDQNPFPQYSNVRFIGKPRPAVPRSWLEQAWKWSAFRGVPAEADLYYLPFAGIPARKKNARTKLVTTVHDVAYLRFPEFISNEKYLAYLRYAVPRQCREADAITTISESTRRDLMELLDIPSEKIHVIYPGCNVEAPPPDAPTCPELRDLPERYLLFLGNFEPRKNIGLIYRALGHCAPFLREQGIQLVIAGAGGWKGESFDALAAELGVGDLIYRAGYVPEAALPALYAGALAFLFPSLYEGFGLPVLEAQRCKTPVITTAVSSLPEVVLDTALLVDPHSPEELAADILRLLQDEELRTDLVTRGFHNSQRFSWEKCAAETMKVFRGVTGA